MEKNNVENAKAFLKRMGCNLASHIINYDTIANYLVVYAHNCGKENELNVKAKPVIFDAKEFKELRKKSGFTLREVEDWCGISNAYLSQLENGKIKKPSYKTVNTLLDLYCKHTGITGGVILK
jgi:hypothetical protein